MRDFLVGYAIGATTAALLAVLVLLAIWVATRLLEGWCV